MSEIDPISVRFVLANQLMSGSKGNEWLQTESHRNPVTVLRKMLYGYRQRGHFIWAAFGIVSNHKSPKR